MYGLQTDLAFNAVFPAAGFAGDESKWYAIHTMARHEKRVAQQLRENEVFTFLPLTQQTRQWSDRRTKVEVPLFSGYAFVRTMAKERLKVLQTPSVLGFVGNGRMGTPIPDEEIDNLQTAMQEKIPLAIHPFLTTGRRVRIRGGSLDGVEGIFVRLGSDQHLVVSVELLHRSVAIRVEGYDIELA